MRISRAKALILLLCASACAYLPVPVPAPVRAPSSQASRSAIAHLVVIIQENHSFDSYFARYCRARPGSNPSCTEGSACCEAGPSRDPGTGARPRLLNDAQNASYDPNHKQACELAEMNSGRMDRFAAKVDDDCGDRRNFAYADSRSAAIYWDLARQGALADRYFQPIAGESSSNDMYFARAQYVFTDNSVGTRSIGSKCGASDNRKTYEDPTIGDLLTRRGVAWAFYAEGYREMLEAQAQGSCPKAPPGCAAGSDSYPCVYDPTDNPFQYYRGTMDDPATQKDLAEFSRALKAGTLPAVSFVKPVGYRTEHPGLATISDGEAFVKGVVDEVMASPYAKDTLVLLTEDESGGYFDHVAPPTHPTADGQPYGPRVPLIALGRFARRNFVSHVEMEHSSIVKFIEWNWLGATGQLGGRDGEVNGIGSLLVPEAGATPVPE